MSPNSRPGGLVRSAAEINEQIRGLWSHPAVPLTREQRAEYERLCAELRQVERGGAAAAA
ncbi:hypothetical protein [Streptomyces misionensis]|uniref:hypothetical protein n=1 Tax=Streptomyces misionensis TaxID=67331 RepID=UPI0036BB48A8